MISISFFFSSLPSSSFALIPSTTDTTGLLTVAGCFVSMPSTLTPPPSPTRSPFLSLVDASFTFRWSTESSSVSTSIRSDAGFADGKDVADGAVTFECFSSAFGSSSVCLRVSDSTILGLFRFRPEYCSSTFGRLADPPLLPPVCSSSLACLLAGCTLLSRNESLPASSLSTFRRLLAVAFDAVEDVLVVADFRRSSSSPAATNSDCRRLPRLLGDTEGVVVFWLDESSLIG
uniref:Putative secreted peptide n=1 Tax=Anopheles braziliensis TaxID=58242 RepID=A0A2M3ZP54_9DIPT